MNRLVTSLVFVVSLVAVVALFTGGCGCSCAEDLQGEDTTTTQIVISGATTTTDGAQATSTTSATSTTLGATSTTLPQAATTSSSSSTTISLGLQLQPLTVYLPDRYEDDSSDLQWVGTWTTVSSPLHSGGTARRSSTLNSRVGIQFEGTGVRLIATTPAVAGRMIVHLYGSGADITDTIDLTGSGETSVVVWESGTIPDGQYQCWFGYDPTNLSGRLIWVDAIDIWPPVPAAP